MRSWHTAIAWISGSVLLMGVGAEACTWRPVGQAGINSHQPGPSWCQNGEYLSALDLDGYPNMAPHDSPIVGAAYCCGWSASNGWANIWPWTPVGTVGINSHQPGPAWCRYGSYLLAVDLDGPRNYQEHDSPIVGQALCATPIGAGGWSSCIWREISPNAIGGFEQAGSWCDEDWFLVSWDLDAEHGYASYFSPIVGRAQCCRP